MWIHIANIVQGNLYCV